MAERISVPAQEDISRVMRYLATIKSEARAVASRRNGLKGRTTNKVKAGWAKKKAKAKKEKETKT
jgi:hypothetical protein